MKSEQIRSTLDAAIKEAGLSYKEVSLAIGRKESYIHRFIKYGLPSKLNENDRRQLSIILGIPEQDLTTFPLSAPIIPTHAAGIQTATEAIVGLFKKKDSISIEILDVTACCGSGIDNLEENVIGRWDMPLLEYRTISTTSNPDNVKMIRARGDSMSPTLKDGDWVLVDTSFRATDSDGLYLILLPTGLAIKRLQGSASGISVISDNPKYPPQTWQSGELKICGKIIYTLNAEKVG